MTGIRRIQSLADVSQADRGTSAAIGNFDGVHLGHQAILEQAKERASGGLSVLTFEPHPREVFHPDGAPFRLMNAATRARCLQSFGVNRVFELTFSPELYTLSPGDFCRKILVDGLGLNHVTVGADFRYGAGRQGNAAQLVATGSRLGFGVTIADLVSLDAGARVSSSAIRRALTEGHPRDAAGMLGHWHRIEGTVIHGEKRGRNLGFPTANMDLTGLHLPRFGVYAVWVDIEDGPDKGRYSGAASLGVRPMFGRNLPNLETFIFDFSADLYGQELRVSLVEFLRPEVAYTGVDALISQMHQDCRKARDILSSAV